MICPSSRPTWRTGGSTTTCTSSSTRRSVRILDALDASGMADDTIVVFTSDHGDLLGAHGGLQQKWCNAFDEATRVPLIVRARASTPTPAASQTPTSHVDLIPTLLGLAGIDVEAAAAGGGRDTTSETQPLRRARPRRRCSRARATEDAVDAPRVLHDRRPDHDGLRTQPVHRRGVRTGGGAGEGRVGDQHGLPTGDDGGPSCGSATTTTTGSTTPTRRRRGSSTTSPSIPRSACQPRVSTPTRRPCSASCAPSSTTPRRDAAGPPARQLTPRFWISVRFAHPRPGSTRSARARGARGRPCRDT